MQIHILSHNKFGKIRVVILNGEIYFLGKDAADSLAFKDTSQAIRQHVQAKDKFTIADLAKMAQGDSQNCPDNLTGQNAAKIPHNAIFINESGLYSLVLYSTLAVAKELQHWVTSEVLPSIRKNGYYINPNAITPPAPPPPVVPESELSRREKIEILRECLNYTDCKQLRNKIIYDIAYLATGKNY